MKEFYVYIVTNPTKTVLYTGMTNDLQRRLVEHYKNRGDKETFAGRYYCYNLIYYEVFDNPADAIQAEKYIKGKARVTKEAIIKRMNPSVAFLNRKVLGYWPPRQQM